MSRRKFLQFLGLGGLMSFSGSSSFGQAIRMKEEEDKTGIKPIVISTWRHGMAANAAAWKILEQNSGLAIDAVQIGVMDAESDPTNMSVGYGGLPDRDGIVTLDACIMDYKGNCGSVAFLQDIEHPIAVARMIMDKTPHVMMVGAGALRFALENGFEKKKLLTAEAEKLWLEWKKTSLYQTPPNIENHDTIGMLAIDAQGNMAGACTTSGMANKMHGRVGDSPIIGAGLFVDNEIGAACATGVGEMVMRVCGSHLVVENMRRGMSPERACKEAVERVIAKHPGVVGQQVGFLALRKDGKYGGYSIYNGFDFAVTHQTKNEMVQTSHKLKWE